MEYYLIIRKQLSTPKRVEFHADGDAEAVESIFIEASYYAFPPYEANLYREDGKLLAMVWRR